MSFVPLVGNASGKGLKALAIAGKGVQKTVVINGCKRTWQQLSKAERMVYQRNFIDTHGFDPWYYRSHSATVYSSMRSRPKSFFPWNST